MKNIKLFALVVLLLGSVNTVASRLNLLTPVGEAAMGIVTPIIVNLLEAHDIYKNKQLSKTYKATAIGGFCITTVTSAAVILGLPIYGAVKATQAIIAKIKDKKAEAPVAAPETREAVIEEKA